MATLEDLKTSILNLPDDEALSLILQRRESRLISKKKPQKSSPKKDAGQKKLEGMSAKQMMTVMSDAEKKKLLEFLKGE